MERPVTHSLVRALREVPGFESVDERMLLALIGESANLYWPEGRIVFERGGPSDGLYIVISGRVHVLGEDGSTLAALGPGDFFGELSLLLGVGHRSDVRVDEAAELMVIPKEKFDELMASHPEVNRHIRAKAEERAATNTAPAAS
ncbi:MAG: cyclic nucleotide-binding domain-containing protein [Gaiellaceae bacterium]